MRPQVAYAYRWSLHDAHFAQVCRIIGALRQHAIDLGGESISNLIVQPEARQAMFTATIPGATAAKYGLAMAGNLSWSWSGAVIVSSVKTISEFHQKAASLGIEVVEEVGGMVFTSRRNTTGLVETEQRPAFDWTDF